MDRRWPVLFGIASLMLVQLGAAAAGPALLAVPPAAPDRPAELAAAMVERWTASQQSAPLGVPMAALAATALDLVELARAGDLTAGRALASLEPLAAAQAELRARLGGSFEPESSIGALARVQDVLAYADARDGPPTLADGLALARRAGAAPDPRADAALHALDVAVQLPALAAAGDPHAFAMAALDAVPAPAPRLPLPSVAAFGSLSSAVGALLESAGHHASAAQAEEIAALDQLPTDLRSALQRVVEANLFQAEVVRLALGQPGAGVDLGLLHGMQTVVSDIVLGAARDMRPPHAPVPTLHVCGVIVLRLSVSDDEHPTECSYRVSVDLGGDDTYRNNAGGATEGAAILIDLAGDDSYVPPSGQFVTANGAGRRGAGALFDLEGADLYSGAGSFVLVNGAGEQGAGLLFDGGGDDRFIARVTFDAAANGGAMTDGLGVLVDAGGNDTYDASAGSKGAFNGGSVDSSVAALIDVDGDDVYTAAVAGHVGGLNGGAAAPDLESVRGGSAALLIDGAGDDRYDGFLGLFGAINGGAFELSSAALIDLEGDDIRTGTSGYSSGINGGTEGTWAHAVLYDGAGNDEYRSVTAGGGANGGAHSGVAVLVDPSGDDVYDGVLLLDPLGIFGPNPGPSFGAVNGGARYLGIAVLLDGSGNDTYEGLIEGSGGINGAGQHGFGAVLLDDAGDDTYRGRATFNGSVNGGALLAWGVLRDAEGDDTYDGFVSRVGGVNGGALLGIGVLIDAAGDNTFTGGVGRLGGAMGAADGHGFAGIRELGLTGDLEFPVEGGPIGFPGGIGLLFGSPGNDRYVGSGTTQGAASLHGIGVLIDPGGHNEYAATSPPGAPGLAQGAGLHLGLGVLLDRGSSGSFDMGSRVVGQGAGLQGVGLLFHAAPEPSAQSTYSSASSAVPSGLGGGGIGLRLDLGVTKQEGTLPVVACEPGTELRDVDPGSETPGLRVHVRTCTPDEATKQPILNPFTGEPLSAVPKPRVPCDEITFPVSCADVVGGALGADAVVWLGADRVTLTTSGGFVLTQGKADVEAEVMTDGRLVMASADDFCQLSCHTIEQVD